MRESDSTNARVSAFHTAQRAIADLKASIFGLLAASPSKGLTNAEVGRSLGIYSGHAGHEGHVPRTVLALMESDGSVEQDRDTKRWKLRSNLIQDSET